MAPGPVLAGLVIVDNQYANVTYVSMAFLLVSFIFFNLLDKQTKNEFLKEEVI